MTNRKSPRIWALLVAICLGSLVGAAGTFWWMGPPPASEQRIQQLEHELMLAQGNLIQVQAMLDTALAHATVDSSTRKTLETTLQETQNEIGDLRDQLAFFNELLPPGPAGAVGIRALDIEPVGPNLRYRVLLMRSGAAPAPFHGTLQFMAEGLQEGKAAKIQLQPAQVALGDGSAGDEDVSITDIPVEFDQFQRNGGLLSVPSGFLPQAITLNVLEGSTVRVSRTVNLPVPE